MIDIVIKSIPVLAIAVMCNIALGMYYNIQKIHTDFSWAKLMDGVIKALIVCGSFVGLAYIFDSTVGIVDFGAFELNPEVIMQLAIVLYSTKACITLAGILGVKK